MQSKHSLVQKDKKKDFVFSGWYNYLCYNSFQITVCLINVGHRCITTLFFIVIGSLRFQFGFAIFIEF